jgi:hypothetical protein
MTIEFFAKPHIFRPLFAVEGKKGKAGGHFWHDVGVESDDHDARR